MDNILATLAEFTTTYPAAINYILAAAVIIQSNLAILFAMLLVVGGALSWGTFFLVVLGTIVASELLLYFTGRFIRNTRFGWRWYKRMKASRRVQYYSYYIAQNLTKLMATARFLIAVNSLILLLAGWSRAKFIPFIKSYLTSLVVWFASVTTVAYFLATGLSYLESEKMFRQVEILVVAIIVLFFAGEFVMKKFVERRIRLETDAKKVGEFVEREMGKIPDE